MPNSALEVPVLDIASADVFSEGGRHDTRKPDLPAPFLVWYDLDEEDVEAIQARSAHEKRVYLADALKLRQLYNVQEDPSNEKRVTIFLDLCLHVFAFCARCKFNNMKTSTVFSMVRLTHISCCEQAQGLVSLEGGYAFFEEQLLRHSVERPPFSISVFAYPEVKAITQYIVHSYFKHLKMYQYVFGTTRQLQVVPHFSVAQRADLSLICPLAEAIHPANAALFKTSEQQSPEAESEGRQWEVAHPAAESEPLDTSGQGQGAESQAEAKQQAVQALFNNADDQRKFESTLAEEVKKVQEDFMQKLQEQEERYAQKLEAASAPRAASSARGEKNPRKKDEEEDEEDERKSKSKPKKKGDAEPEADADKKDKKKRRKSKNKDADEEGGEPLSGKKKKKKKKKDE
jgi:hypothetical protein